MSKKRKSKKVMVQKYPEGGYTLDWFTKLQKLMSGVTKDPFSNSSQDYLKDLMQRNQYAGKSREEMYRDPNSPYYSSAYDQDASLNNDFNQWLAQNHGSVSQGSPEYEQLENEYYTNVNPNATQDYSISNKDFPTISTADQAIETGAGIMSLMKGQEAYDLKQSQQQDQLKDMSKGHSGYKYYPTGGSTALNDQTLDSEINNKVKMWYNKKFNPLMSNPIVKIMANGGSVLNNLVNATNTPSPIGIYNNGANTIGAGAYPGATAPVNPGVVPMLSNISYGKAIPQFPTGGLTMGNTPVFQNLKLNTPVTIGQPTGILPTTPYKYDDQVGMSPSQQVMQDNSVKLSPSIQQINTSNQSAFRPIQEEVDPLLAVLEDAANVSKPAQKNSYNGNKNTPWGSLNNESVKAIQEGLKKQGFDPGAIDGKWGSKTQAAYNRLQDSFKSSATETETLSTDAGTGTGIMQQFKKERDYKRILNKIKDTEKYKDLNFIQKKNFDMQFKSQYMPASFEVQKGLTLASFIPGGGAAIKGGQLAAKGAKAAKPLYQAGKTAVNTAKKNFTKKGTSVAEKRTSAMIDGRNVFDKTKLYRETDGTIRKLADTRGGLQKIKDTANKYIKMPNISTPVKNAINYTAKHGKRISDKAYNALTKLQKNKYNNFVKDSHADDAVDLFGGLNTPRKYQTGGFNIPDNFRPFSKQLF